MSDFYDCTTLVYVLVAVLVVITLMQNMPEGVKKAVGYVIVAILLLSLLYYAFTYVMNVYSAGKEIVANATTEHMMNTGSVIERVAHESFVQPPQEAKLAELNRKRKELEDRMFHTVMSKPTTSMEHFTFDRGISATKIGANRSRMSSESFEQGPGGMEFTVPESTASQLVSKPSASSSDATYVFNFNDPVNNESNYVTSGMFGSNKPTRFNANKTVGGFQAA